MQYNKLMDVEAIIFTMVIRAIRAIMFITRFSAIMAITAVIAIAAIMANTIITAILMIKQSGPLYPIKQYIFMLQPIKRIQTLF